MQINITFIIQIGNFFATYWFLNKLFFEPFFGIIEKNNAEIDGLLTRIKEQEKMVEELDQQKKDTLVAFQHHVRKKYKMPAKQCCLLDTSIFSKRLPKTRSDQAFVERVEEIIGERVSHDY